MQLQGDFTFEGPREAVWDLLQDPDVLVTALPGAKELHKVGDDEYAARLQVRVGPVNGVFDTKVVLTDKIPPERYTMQIEGKSSVGFTRGAAHVTLTEQAANTTLMQYEATLQVGGRLASVGQRMLDTVGKSLTRQGLEAMNEALQARLGAATSEAREDTYTPPTQADFARGVARDVVAETVKSRSIIWAVAFVIILVVVIVFLLSR
ncbi:MAG: CoxG family protein [Rhodothermales bacterium]